MRRRWRLLLGGLSLGLLCANSGTADEYLVQIGAFNRPSADFGARAEPFGHVLTRRTASGLTRFQVGPFTSEQEARVALTGLREAGYGDAFVLRASAVDPLPAVGAGPPRSAEDRLQALPAELRGRIVYLDGVLHVKEGERFIPLDRYEGGRYR